jgi:hypothetical protein
MPQDWEPKDWAEEQAHRVAREINRLRGKRSAQWLADQTAKLGYPVSRSVIADLENGRRRYVTTAELTVLASVLETAPIALLFPPPYDEHVDMLPDEEVVSKLVAAEAFCGHFPALNAFFRGEHARLLQNTEPLRQAREIARLKDHQRWLIIQMEEFGEINPAFARQARAELGRISEQLVELEATDDGR